tara:strand:- start:262 stop:1356 length:1095 start_codon:yes stop_codon:yes gene_type:complete
MKIRIVFLLSLLYFFSSCDTDDVLPTLTLTESSIEISEDGGLTIITATLNAATDQDITIPFAFSGTATYGEDYIISEQDFIIPSGATSVSLSISSMQDNDVEEIETIRFLHCRPVGVSGDVGGDCPAGFSCSDGPMYCQGAEDYLTSEITISILDDDADSDGDGINDSDDDCPIEAGVPEYNGCSQPPQPLLIINEVLYDPPSGIEGDANGDGTREAQEDEFIEFVNLGGSLDISGYTVHDNAQERHIFPQGTIIPSGGVLVLFGGGNPTGAFGNAIVQIASAGILNMNNAGDFVTVYNPNGEVVLTFDVEPLSNNPDESYTRYPDLNLEPGDDGILFYQHAGIGEALGAYFSPGTKIDGTNFN